MAQVRYIIFDYIAEAIYIDKVEYLMYNVEHRINNKV
jgi:hypothetical protein